MDGCTAKRLLTAVQGDKKRKGELFGIKNLLRVRVLSRNKSCLTENIEKRHSDFEKKILKKARVALSVEDFELEDAVVKAENISKDPYQIGLDLELDLQEDLDESSYGGVIYTHSNDKIVGGSKEEEIISRLAQQTSDTREGSSVAVEKSCEEDSLGETLQRTPPCLPGSTETSKSSSDLTLSPPKFSPSPLLLRFRGELLRPEGIFFKKRKRTDFECDEEIGKNELDELFPTPKFEKCKSDQNQNKKSREVKKQSYYVETIEDIFG